MGVKRMHKEVLLEKRVLRDAFMKQKYGCKDGGDVQHVITDMALQRDLNSDEELKALLEEFFRLMPATERQLRRRWTQKRQRRRQRHRRLNQHNRRSRLRRQAGNSRGCASPTVLVGSAARGTR